MYALRFLWSDLLYNFSFWGLETYDEAVTTFWQSLHMPLQVEYVAKGRSAAFIYVSQWKVSIMIGLNPRSQL
jgi:hypothetical protein